MQGFAAIAGERGLLLITGLGFAQTFTRGCLSVLTVAVAIELLDIGEAGVGVLSAAIGGGAVLGSILTFRLVGAAGSRPGSASGSRSGARRWSCSA